MEAGCEVNEELFNKPKQKRIKQGKSAFEVHPVPKISPRDLHEHE
jgi:hypothetical protein